jgi:N-acetylmuramoyl-L-alanine amidase
VSYVGIVVDYGHGGIIDNQYQTAGKQYTFTDYDDYWVGEGVLNRKTAAYLIRYALEAGVRVWDAVAQKEWTKAPRWTELEQRDTSLSSRVAYANTTPQRSAIYLSLHSNAIGNGLSGSSQSARGACFYTSYGQTGSDQIATSLHDAFQKIVYPSIPIRGGEWSDGDVDYEAGFYVLVNTASAAVLGEIGFFTNITDARFLDSAEGQQRIARAYLTGVQPFIG